MMTTSPPPDQWPDQPAEPDHSHRDVQRDLPRDPRHRLGLLGESIAARHLTRGGMVLLDRNWRSPSGEIDLVLRDDTTLVFCEVKTRTSHAFGSPFEAVDETKLRRMRRCAAQWVAAHDVHPPDLRLDMVGVLVPLHGRIEVEHVAGIG